MCLSLQLQKQSYLQTFSFRISVFDQFQQIVRFLTHQSSPTSSHYHHLVWLLCFFLSAMPLVECPPSKELIFGIIKMSTNVRQAVAVVVAQEGFWLLNSPMAAIFVWSLSYLWIVNVNLEEDKWSCSNLDVLLGCFVTSQMSHQHTLGLTCHGMVHHCAMVFPLVWKNNGTRYTLVYTHSLRNDFATLPETQWSCFSSIYWFKPTARCLTGSS